MTAAFFSCAEIESCELAVVVVRLSYCITTIAAHSKQVQTDINPEILCFVYV